MTSLIQDALHIRCGATTPDPEKQAALDTLTTLHDLTTGENHTAGCGALVLWWDSFRCLDCEKFMHKDCLVIHFRRTSYP